MAKVTVSVVHDELGEIISVSRPENRNVIVLSGERQSMVSTEVDEDYVESLIGTHRVDVSDSSLVSKVSS